MEFNNFWYIILLLVTLAVPLAFSFNSKIHFYNNIKYLLPALLFVTAIFIIWDLRFEERAIWHFNPEFVMGKYVLNLPVEEWLYFPVVSYLGVFVYEFLKHRFPNFQRPNSFLVLSLVLLVLFGVLAFLSRQKLYSFFTFFLLTIYMAYTIFRNRFKKHYSKFYLAYFILLVPFLIINGVLTALPIIEYNPLHILGIEIYTIPIENFAALFLLLLMNITIYEYLKERRIY